MSDIPNTESVRVAKLAAALRLAEAKRDLKDSDSSMDVLRRFIDAYEIVSAADGKGAEAAREILEGFKAR